MEHRCHPARTHYLAITLTAAIKTEEAHLTEKFGRAYPEYREGRAAGGHRRFSFARAMRNREYRAVVGLLVVIGVLAWKMRRMAIIVFWPGDRRACCSGT